MNQENLLKTAKREKPVHSPQRKSPEINFAHATANQTEKFESANGEEETSFETLVLKINPMYRLLYSPLHSLKSKEKDMLIEALAKDLKDKTVLLKQCQKLKQEKIQMKLELKRKDE